MRAPPHHQLQIRSFGSPPKTQTVHSMNKCAYLPLWMRFISAPVGRPKKFLRNMMDLITRELVKRQENCGFVSTRCLCVRARVYVLKCAYVWCGSPLICEVRLFPVNHRAECVPMCACVQLGCVCVCVCAICACVWVSLHACQYANVKWHFDK